MHEAMHGAKKQLPPGVWPRGQEQLQRPSTTGSKLSCKSWVEPQCRALQLRSANSWIQHLNATMLGALALGVSAKSHPPTAAATHQSGVSQRMFLRTRYKLSSKQSTLISACYILGSKYASCCFFFAF